MPLRVMVLAIQMVRTATRAKVLRVEHRIGGVISGVMEVKLKRMILTTKYLCSMYLLYLKLAISFHDQKDRPEPVPFRLRWTVESVTVC